MFINRRFRALLRCSPALGNTPDFRIPADLFVPHAIRSSSTSHAKGKRSLIEDGYRNTLAPWLKFGQYEKGLLAHLSTSEILRALFVLQLCSFDVIVDNSRELFQLSKKFGTLAESLARSTFYNQFVGGEEVKASVVELLHRRGLTLMVAPVLEEDVEDEKSSRSLYDENATSLKKIARMTGSADKNVPIVQLKLSAIMPAKTLEQVDIGLRDCWKDASKLALVTEELSTQLNGGGRFPSSCGFLGRVAVEDKEYFQSGIRRADEFVKLAKDSGVTVLVDAEFYSCKLAISTIAMALMRKYNGEGYVVGDTIQGYLKDAETTVNMELSVVEKLLGSHWYGKIVRGAYMDRERYLAKKNGVPSPICESYEETNTSYDRCIQTVLQHLAGNRGGGGGHLLIATHNEKSIRLAVQQLTDLGIEPKNEIASFAQIYGMADYLSTPLVNAGYKVYKSTPFGPFARVFPYLSRRASENRSVFKGTREELKMLRKELLSRML